MSDFNNSLFGLALCAPLSIKCGNKIGQIKIETNFNKWTLMYRWWETLKRKNQHWQGKDGKLQSDQGQIKSLKTTLDSQNCYSLANSENTTKFRV